MIALRLVVAIASSYLQFDEQHRLGDCEPFVGGCWAVTSVLPVGASFLKGRAITFFDSVVFQVFRSLPTLEIFGIETC